jgi:hypothetical protein
MADRTRELKDNRPERGDVLLWIAALAGPFSWILAELLSYSLAPTACWLGRPLLLYLVPLVSLPVTLTGALIARHRWRREPAGSTERGEPGDSRSRFMAIAAFWMCAGFALVILATAVPPLVLRVCD